MIIETRGLTRRLGAITAIDDLSGEVVSLNVSTVSAILAFEAVRQRRAASAGS